MSNDLVRAAQTSLVRGNSASDTAGNVLLYAGGAGISLGVLAWVLPFITLPMLMVAAVVGGVYLKLK